MCSSCANGKVGESYHRDLAGNCLFLVYCFVSVHSFFPPRVGEGAYGVGFVLIFPPPGEPKELMIAVVYDRLAFNLWQG